MEIDLSLIAETEAIRENTHAVEWAIWYYKHETGDEQSRWEKILRSYVARRKSGEMVPIRQVVREFGGWGK